jgi:WD40 repeat protein
MTDHEVWSASGDNVVVALPGARQIAIGDRAGHVHIMAAGSTAEDMNKVGGDVSFLGHNAPVRQLTFNAEGTLIASAANDNTLRVWDVATGQPRGWNADVAGAAVTRLAMSPDNVLLAALNGSDVRLINIDSGELVADVVLGTPHSALAFVGGSQLYVGSDDGSLSLLQSDANGSWSLRRLWQGESAIRWLEASPRGEFLVLVDDQNLASQFVLQDGRISEARLQLPSRVHGVSFNGRGGRVMFRTARWVHRASASLAGLQLLDSVFVSKALPGARIVAGLTDDGELAANRSYLPVLRNEFLEVAELGFDVPGTAGLFGNREELIAEWRAKLAGTPPLTQ